MLDIILIICFAIIFYTYIGHPFFLYILAVLYPRNWEKGAINPSVAVYVSAFNEEKHIGQKLKNILAQDYPNLTVVIANDGSKDKTAEIVKSIRDVRIQLFDFPYNRGKAAMQNDIIPQLKAEIIVFSDATSEWSPDTLRKITSNFRDPHVGGVAVDLMFIKTTHGSIVEEGQGAYWKYERFLRIHGARVWTNIMVSGTTYAIRRRLFKPIPLDVPEDLANPLNVAMAGYRIVFDPTIVVKETSASCHSDEYRMRVRIATRAVTALFTFWRYLHPKYGFAAYQLLMHKFFRIFCWIPIMLAFIINFFTLTNNFFILLSIVQSIFYFAAILGFFLGKRGCKALFFYIPYYFVLLNWSCMIGFLNYCRGIRKPTWSTFR